MLNSFIFWDWNGTLLDDIDICIDSMNAMLDRRSMKRITKNRYKEIFNFPVIDYYRVLGFDFTRFSFEALSVEFISEYNFRVHLASLHKSVHNILETFRRSNKTQVIVSAMEQNMLEDLLKQHALSGYFHEVLGLNDIYANSKVHLAQSYIDRNNIKPKQITLIGDTIHDAEVAKEIGANLILISHGHHSHKRLTRNGGKVIRKLDDLPGIMN
jgi:phosphoglycolate phosphatase